jgi:hypothetical protein
MILATSYACESAHNVAINSLYARAVMDNELHFGRQYDLS